MAKTQYRQTKASEGKKRKKEIIFDKCRETFIIFFFTWHTRNVTWDAHMISYFGNSHVSSS